MDKLKPRAIIFDLGSTLIEYEAVPWDELNDRCLENGYQFLLDTGHEPPPRDEFLDRFNAIRASYRDQANDMMVEWDVPMVAGQLFDQIGLERQDKLIEAFFDAYYEPVDRELFVYDDTIETLELLKPSYPVMGLVSNTIFPERVHHRELERFELASFLKFKIFSSTFRLRKPHQDIFLQACNLAGFAPSECLYVGDRYLEDIVGPTEIGMSAILKVKPGRKYPEEMPLATRRIDRLIELLDCLEQ